MQPPAELNQLQWLDERLREVKAKLLSLKEQALDFTRAEDNASAIGSSDAPGHSSNNRP